MIQIDVRSNIREVQAEIVALADRVKNKATARALNRALDSAATLANRKVREIYNVRAAAVSRTLSKQRAHPGQIYLRATLTVRGRRMNLYDFGARQTRAGVSVKVKVGGPRKVIPGTFIATNSHTGFRGVFVRVGRERYPIRNLRSVSIPQMIRNRVVIDALRQTAREVFTRNFRQQVRFLGQMNGGSA